MDTIVPVDSSVGTRFGASSRMTLLDRYKLNAAYGCADVLPAACGGLLTPGAGDAPTSGDLRPDAGASACRWDIVAPAGSVVLVTFHTVQVRVGMEGRGGGGANMVIMPAQPILAYR